MALLGDLNPATEPWAGLGYLHFPGSEEAAKGCTHWLVADFSAKVRGRFECRHGSCTVAMRVHSTRQLLRRTGSKENLVPSRAGCGCLGHGRGRAQTRLKESAAADTLQPPLLP